MTHNRSFTSFSRLEKFWSIFYLSVSLLVISPTDSYLTRFEGVSWDDKLWTLNNTVLNQGHYQSRISLSNGYFSINLAALGPFFEIDGTGNGNLDLSSVGDGDDTLGPSQPRGQEDINGWPLFDRRQSFATIAGFYDSQPQTNSSNFPWLSQYGGESVVSGIPHWAGLILRTRDNHILDAATDSSFIKNFRSSLDIGAGGVFRSSFDWTPPLQPALRVEYSTFLNKLHINRATVQVRVTATEDTSISVIDLLEGACAARTDPVEKFHDSSQGTICSAVRPIGLPTEQVGYVCSALRVKAGDNPGVGFQIRASSQVTQDDGLLMISPSASASTIAQSVKIKLQRGRTVVVEKYVGAASKDAFSNPRKTALEASKDGARLGFEAELEVHRKEWANLLNEDTTDSFRDPETRVIPDDDLDLVELQILAITNAFYLLQNTLSPNAIKLVDSQRPIDVWSIPVCGLGGSCYGGMIFWDSELWMAPGLTASFPDSSKQIVNYRVDRYKQAQENVKMAFTSSKNETNRFTPGGAVYPWTSGRFGNCTATGPCFDYEYHINGDIGLSFVNYLITSGDIEFFKDKLFPIYDSIAQFFSQLLEFDPMIGRYGLRNATDPDEFANRVNNPAYTMALISNHLDTANEFRRKFGLPKNSSWESKSRTIAVPIDYEAKIIDEYEGMNSSISVKQADVILIDDFLDYPNDYSLNDLEYYAQRQSLIGPAMTYSSYSIVSNRFTTDGCSSYTYNLYGTKPYVRAPWFQFGEQISDNLSQNGGSHPAFPFLTGIGGSYRVAVYGYLGLRLKFESLSIDPSLPAQIPHLEYRTFYWQGHPIKARSNYTHTQIWRPFGIQPKKTANPVYSSEPIPIRIGTLAKALKLYPSGPSKSTLLTVPNRVKNITDPLQCQPIKTTIINNDNNKSRSRSAAASSLSLMPNEIPNSINDGSSSTIWRPQNLSFSSGLITLTISLNQNFRNRSIEGFALKNCSNVKDFDLIFFNDRKRNYHHDDGNDSKGFGGEDDEQIKFITGSSSGSPLMRLKGSGPKPSKSTIISSTSTESSFSSRSDSKSSFSFSSSNVFLRKRSFKDGDDSKDSGNGKGRDGFRGGKGEEDERFGEDGNDDEIEIEEFKIRDLKSESFNLTTITNNSTDQRGGGSSGDGDFNKDYYFHFVDQHQNVFDDYGLGFEIFNNNDEDGGGGSYRGKFKKDHHSKINHNRNSSRIEFKSYLNLSLIYDKNFNDRLPSLSEFVLLVD